MSASRVSPGFLSGYLLGWAADTGAPTWWQLTAAWPGGAVGTPARASLFACKLGPGGKEACSDTQVALQLTIDAGGKRVTLTGLGPQPLVLDKAGQLTPVLASPPF